MANVSKNVVSVILIAVCVLVFVGLKAMRSNVSVQPVSGTVKKLLPRAAGNPSADIKIIEFIDFQCPACATGAKTLHQYLDQYPGKLYVELRYFPLQMHQHGLKSARWGECAARQGKFWEFLNPLLENQSSWASLGDPDPAFTNFAKSAGIDLNQLTACLQDESVERTINADVDEGKMRQVSSTPSYFINHQLVVGSKSLQSRLDDLLGIKKEEPREILKYDSIKSERIPVDAN